MLECLLHHRIHFCPPSKPVMVFFIVTTCLLGSLFIASSYSSGKVGECRTECAERNSYKIVRVHLKEIDVNVGLCRNTSEGALVFAFTCDRRVGAWSHDAQAEDAVEFFSRPCPTVEIVREELMADCPSIDKNSTIILEMNQLDGELGDAAVKRDEFARRLVGR